VADLTMKVGNLNEEVVVQGAATKRRPGSASPAA